MRLPTHLSIISGLLASNKLLQMQAHIEVTLCTLCRDTTGRFQTFSMENRFSQIVKKAFDNTILFEELPKKKHKFAAPDFSEKFLYYPP